MSQNLGHHCTCVYIMVLYLIDEHYLFFLFILDSKTQHSPLQISALQNTFTVMIISLLDSELLDRDNNVFVFVQYSVHTKIKMFSFISSHLFLQRFCFHKGS